MAGSRVDHLRLALGLARAWMTQRQPGASIADGQRLACRAWQAPSASGVGLLHLLSLSTSLQNVLKWSSIEVRGRHDCSKHE